MAHATSNAKAPAKQGLFGIFEVFIDTILLCSLTAFVILLSFDDIPLLNGGGIMLVISAFSHTFGKNAGFLISVCIFFFAFATIICWAFYGESCVKYFTKSRKISNLYLFFFSLLLIYGSIAVPQFIWGATDTIVSSMTIINVIAITIMADKVVSLSADYDLIKIKGRGYERKDERPKSKVCSPCRLFHSR